jgi:transposase
MMISPSRSLYRLKIALRQAGDSIGNLKDTHLSNFFNRIAYRKGRAVAVSARKLANILWNMLYKNNNTILLLFMNILTKKEREWSMNFKNKLLI